MTGKSGKYDFYTLEGGNEPGPGMIVGVTGTRRGRPPKTVQRLRALLLDWGATELHHGDCVGWDEQAHWVARGLGLRVVSHPPENHILRARCKADIELPVLPYLERNRAIVLASDRLIAAPSGPETTRSGTWWTVRAAKEAGKHGVILPWN